MQVVAVVSDEDSTWKKERPGFLNILDGWMPILSRAV